jgi:hypothetical protein
MSGRVVHFEIAHDDADRARSFYEKALGWKLQPMPEMRYTLVTTGPSGDQGRRSPATSTAASPNARNRSPAPGWEPTPASYKLAVAQLDGVRRILASVGIRREEVVVLWTAMATGLTDQQISNDPGGDRWSRLTNLAVDMFFDHFGIDDSGRA